LVHEKIFNNQDITDQKLFTMKTISLLFLATLLIGFVSCNTDMVDEALVESPKDVTSFQKYMLDEINLARTNPAVYAESRLRSESESLSDNGSYLYLKKLAPVSPLSFNSALNMSSSKYALLLAEKNLMGHNEDGTPLKRAITVGFTGTAIGENIAASSGEAYNATINAQSAAIGFVRIMIIDEGVNDLGHRLVMLNSKYKTIGIGYVRNPASTYVNYNVQNFGNQ
jgi:hypothetical protein